MHSIGKKVSGDWLNDVSVDNAVSVLYRTNTFPCFLHKTKKYTNAQVLGSSISPGPQKIFSWSTRRSPLPYAALSIFQKVSECNE